MNAFKQLGLSQKVTTVLEGLKFEKPTDIQDQTIPLILEGKDVIGNAATGSGKTLAFASGIIEKAVVGGGIQALVLAPTRELAEQIATVMRTLAAEASLTVQEIFGGVGFEPQVAGAHRSEIIVGTPGRILDHLQRASFDFMELKVLVLDEADRMVDMGFMPDVEKIIGQCPIKRQTLLFSATSSADVSYMEQKYMRDPVHVAVEQYVDASQLTQEYYDVPSHLKFSTLVHFLKKETSGIVMVFCNTRKNVDLVVDNLQRQNIQAHAIHGGFDQKKRSRVIEQFHKNEAQILVCTDVAARGLDIKNVTHVYNYDAPKSPEEYVHRVGRTARAGKKGLAVNIVSQRDYDNFRRVMEDDSLKIEHKELPEIEQVSAHFNDRGYGRGGTGGDRRGSYRRGPAPHGGGRGRGGSGHGRSRGGPPRGRSGGRRSGGSHGRGGGRSFGGRGRR